MSLLLITMLMLTAHVLNVEYLFTVCHRLIWRGAFHHLVCCMKCRYVLEVSHCTSEHSQ